MNLASPLVGSLASVFQNDQIERIGWVLIHSLWQFALMALVAFIAMAATRAWTAERRYQLLLATFGLMVAMPVATWFLMASAPSHITAEPAASPIQNAALDSATNEAHTSTPTLSKEPRLNTSEIASANTDSADSKSGSLIKTGNRWSEFVAGARQLLDQWIAVLVMGWCIGVALFSLRPLVGWLAIRRLLRVGVSPPSTTIEAALRRIGQQLKIAQGVRVLESTIVKTPLVVGYFRPAILLPISIIANLPTAQLESILVHEFAHIRRHDFLVNLLQTLCETLFFYHPAIWWLSQRIRIEREHCCDDMAVSWMGDKVAYGRALLSLEELRGAERALALGARDGSLVSRVRRMLYGEPAKPFLFEQMNWVACALAASLVIAVLYLSTSGSTLAAPSNQDAAIYQKGGEAVKGLVLRVISAAPKTNEQKATMDAAVVSQFAAPGEVTLVAELKNVSDKAIRLVGVRYGEGVSAPSVGKSNTRRFGPILFQYAFRTKDGDLIEPPFNEGLGNPFLELSGALIEQIEPGQSIVCALRPLETRYDAMHWLPPGEYTLEVSYVGVDDATQAEMTKHWPKMGFTGLWNGKASSNVIPLTIADQPKLELEWGPTTSGLQAAIEFRDGDTYRAEGAPKPPPHEFPVGAAVSSLVHIKNVSDKPITFWTEEFRQGDTIEVTDATGKVTRPGVPFFTGWAVMSKWTLRPGEIAATYSNIGSGMMQSPKTRGRGSPTLSPEAISFPGTYTAQIELNFGGLQTKDAKGNPVPGPNDFSGKLKTGKAAFTVRQRNASDDPPKVTASIVLKSKSGEAIRGGHVTITEVGGEVLFDKQIDGDRIELSGVDGIKPCYAAVRANGFEEQTFYELELSEKMPVTLELTKAKPVTMQLHWKGQPISGAKIRHFVRSKAKANGGPFPMKGIEGDVWATSNERGEVLLDTLQKTDPFDAKLGDNVYWFYVEPPAEFAGKFIGPITAGQDLGEIALGKPITVRGEVHGTPAELDRFVAEWDQPEAVGKAGPDKPWDYAVSQNLEVHRVGDKLTFELNGLRPGRLRFVSNFQGQSSGHEYAKRMVGPTDVVLELNLTESRSDVVLTSKKTELPK